MVQGHFSDRLCSWCSRLYLPLESFHCLLVLLVSFLPSAPSPSTFPESGLFVLGWLEISWSQRVPPLQSERKQQAEEPNPCTCFAVLATSGGQPRTGISGPATLGGAGVSRSSRICMKTWSCPSLTKESRVGRAHRYRLSDSSFHKEERMPLEAGWQPSSCF